MKQWISRIFKQVKDNLHNYHEVSTLRSKSVNLFTSINAQRELVKITEEYVYFLSERSSEAFCQKILIFLTSFVC